MASNLQMPTAILVYASLTLAVGFYLAPARLGAETSPHSSSAPRPDAESPPALTPEDAALLQSIREKIGAVVPPGGLLDRAPAGNDFGDSELWLAASRESNPAGSRCRAAQLAADDELAIAIKGLEQRIESRARNEAAQGNWELGIALHQLAVRMVTVVAPTQ